MIETLVKLLEKVIELVKAKRDAEEKMFSTLVTPIFTDLQTVHTDYLQLFETCERDIRAGTALSTVATSLLGDRLEREALRESIRAFVFCYASNPRLHQYADFFNAVGNYLRGEPRRSAGGAMWAKLEWWVREEGRGKLLNNFDDRAARQEILEKSQEELACLRRYWVTVSAEYAKLMTKVA